MNTEFQPYAQAHQVAQLADWIRADSFTPLPDDWQVLVSDVRGSTKAIARGEFKAVNALGSACVVAATNACGQDAIPFVFGGDGALVAVPPRLAGAVGAAWLALSERAQATTGLALRVGCVSVAEIRARGADILVAKRVMPGGFELALFSGGGVSLADELVKGSPQTYAVQAGAQDQLSVEGLECRWNDVPSTQGRIMTLLVRVRNHELGRLRPLLRLLERMMPLANPVRRENLPLTWPPRHLAIERAYRCARAWMRWPSWLGIWLLTGLFSGLVRHQADDASSKAGAYIASLVLNTDHVKLDDMFRAVLDVTPAQAARIEEELARLHAAGDIHYGIHYSDHALMTCFVRSLERHVHFVDGGDGGYALAAVQLKASMARTAASG